MNGEGLLKRLRLYVAHTLGLKDEVAENVFPKLIPYFDIVDPFRDRREAYKGKSEEEIREMILEMCNPSWPVVHDLKDIDGCDALLMLNMGGPSYGSTLELAYAKRERNIPCVCVVKERYRWHPWLRDYAITVTDDVGLAIKSLLIFFGMEKG